MEDSREEEAQVDAGKKNRSPIIKAIAAAEKHTTGEIRVHLSRDWIEKNPYAKAQKLFHQFGMTKTSQRNAVLLYINVRKRVFAIVGDEGIHQAVGQRYWEGLVRNLKEDLLSTHVENAIALCVFTIGATLKKFFPIDVDVHNQNEIPDLVTED